MKKLKYLALLLLIIPVTGKAAVFHCSAPGTVTSGSTISVRIYGSLSSGNSTWKGTIVGQGNVSYQSGDLSIWHDGANFDRTVTFKAGNPGQAKFYVGGIDVSDENQEYGGSDVCTVNIVAANSSNSSGSKRTNTSSGTQTNKSSNNNLKSLSINDVTISPEFDKEKLEYSAVVEGTQERININAEAEDGKASVSGTGEKDLDEGLNEIVVSVIAENGDVKEYKISITRKEKNPIEVTVGKKKYTVLKKETELEIPEGFTKTTIVMNKQDVVAYSNEYTAYMLVVLVDEEGNANFYVYDKKNDTYVEYVEFESKNIKLMLMEPKKGTVPYKYKKVTFPVDGKVVNGYYLEYKSDFRLVYGMNMANGDVDFYLYDMEQKTFQRFYNIQVETYIDLVKKFKYLALGIGGLTFILFIVTIALLVKNRKIKKKLKNGVKEEPKKEMKKEEPKSLTREERLKLREEAKKEDFLAETKKVPEVKEEKVDKKALRKAEKEKRKEEKLKAKEAKRLEKEALKKQKAEPKVTDNDPQDNIDRRAVRDAKKELKRLQKEEDKKRKAEASDFLK